MILGWSGAVCRSRDSRWLTSLWRNIRFSARLPRIGDHRCVIFLIGEDHAIGQDGAQGAEGSPHWRHSRTKRRERRIFGENRRSPLPVQPRRGCCRRCSAYRRRQSMAGARMAMVSTTSGWRPQIVIGAPYDDLNGLTRPPPPWGTARPLRVAFHICEDAITTLAANCLNGGFEMLAVFDGASPDVRSV
jgi:hypothetical protein